MGKIVELRDVTKTFSSGEKKLTAVDNVSLSVEEGEIFGIIGFSGAGKSTLVRTINLLENPDKGFVSVNGTKLAWEENGVEKIISSKELKKVRSQVGMIFQHFNLLDRSTVFENVAYPLQFTGKSKKEITGRVFELLDLVGLTEKANVYPSQLSGGQKQRVAIARALANNPAILLSDEATSALDPEATESILELLKELNKKLRLTIILITHEMAVIKSVCQKVAVMENGRIVESGSVYEIFANPEKEISKRFVESQSSLSNLGKLVREKSGLVDVAESGKLLRLQFEGDVAGKAAISEISRLFSVGVNIVLANIDILSEGALGRIIVVLNGNEKSVGDALAYLEEKKIKVTEINPADFLTGGNE